MINFLLDINECKSGANDCHQKSFCNNTIGSYHCICNEGYEGTGQTCVGKIIDTSLERGSIGMFYNYIFWPNIFNFC